MRRPLRLELEQLEDRLTPASTATPWIIPEHLTLSLAPDGTNAGTVSSNLVQTLNREIPTRIWQQEALRAFQTWAVLGNVNIGLVADGGQPLGAPGLVQRDSRFGDIRLAARPMSPETVAAANAFRLTGGTWSGDVVLNSKFSFSAGGAGTSFDLFSVLLHEAGHVFGLADATDQKSAMYEKYLGVRTGPSAQDIDDFQSLYGARQTDRYDDDHSNDVPWDATGLHRVADGINADITTLKDVDYYRFTADDSVRQGSPLNVRVRTSGISLLVPSLAVYDRDFNVVGTARASNPLNGNLTVSIPDARPGNRYYVRVGSAAQDVFGIGAYQLTTNQDNTDNDIDTFWSTVNDERRSNDTLNTATRLTKRNSGETRLSYSYIASLTSADDVDVYRVRSPQTAGNAAQEMTVLISAMKVNDLAARADVYDQSGNPLAAQVIGNDRGFFSVRIANAQSDQIYFVKISALAPTGRHATGNYFLGVNFSPTTLVPVKTYAAGALTPAVPTQVQTVTFGRATAVQFILNANAAASAGAAQIQMLIFDAAGKEVFRLIANANEPSSTGVAYLNAGTYLVRYVAVAKDGRLSATLNFSLKGIILNDPIGPEPVAGSTPPPEGDPSTWTELDYLALAILYGYVDPYYY